MSSSSGNDARHEESDNAPIPPVEAVIFDRDGVLTDFDVAAAEAFFGPRVPLSLWEISDRWEAHGERVGFPRSMAEEEAFFRSFWDGLCDELGLGAHVRRDLQAFDYTTCLTVYPDVLPALKVARKAGLRVGVLSNFALASLAQSLQSTGLAEWVDVALAATVIGAAKPQPAAYRTAAARLETTPEACLFFDDEPECVAGAAAVGMAAYRVDRRRKSHDPQQNRVADLTYLSELLLQAPPRKNSA